MVLMLIYLLVSLFQPLFLRRSFIENVGRSVRVDVPQTAQIIEYRFGINRFGVEPFLVKLEICQKEYNDLQRYFSVNDVQMQRFDHVRQHLNYESQDVYTAIEIGWRDTMMAKHSLFRLFGATRVYESFIVKTADGRHLLYLFY